MEIDGVVKMPICPFMSYHGGCGKVECYQSSCQAWSYEKKDCRLMIRPEFPFIPGSYGADAND